MKRFTLLTAFIISILTLTACSSLHSIPDSKGSGKKKTYNATVDDTWEAMLIAVSQTKGFIRQEHKDTCTVLAEYNMSMFSWGENVAVFCYKKSDKTTEVEVISKAKVATNITASNWTDDVFRELDYILVK